MYENEFAQLVKALDTMLDRQQHVLVEMDQMLLGLRREVVEIRRRIEKQAEEAGEDTWESLGRGFIAHEPHQADNGKEE